MNDLMALKNLHLSPTFNDFNFSSNDLDWSVKLQDSLDRLQTVNNYNTEDPFNSNNQTFALDQKMNENLVVEDDFDYDPTESAFQAEEAIQKAVGALPDNAILDVQTGFFEEEEVVVEEGVAHLSKDDYFAHLDEKIAQNWAGPQHWKIRRYNSNNAGYNANNSSSTKKQTSRREKEVQVIDFEHAMPELSLLFAKPSNPSVITIGKNVIVDRANSSFLLPEDVHFSSLDLLKLFTKPEFKIGESKKSILSKKPSPFLKGNEEVLDVRDGAQFWASQAPQQNVPEAPAVGDTIDDDYNDDDDFAHQQSFNQTNPVLSVVIPEKPNGLDYARKARRIDVQLLKERMWDQISKSHSKEETEFDRLIQDTREVFIGDRSLSDEQKDISVSFCFICLLHLANENNLELSTGEQGQIRIQQQVTQ